MARFYGLMIKRDLFGAVRVQVFADAEAAEILKALARAKRLSGLVRGCKGKPPALGAKREG